MGYSEMVVTEFSALVSSIKGISDIAKGLKSAYDQHTITQATNEILQRLQSVLEKGLLLQEKHLALLQEKDDLTKRLVEMDEWKATKGQYRLIEISPGSFVYSPNESHPSPQPIHWLCQNCLDNKHSKSVLQLAHKGHRMDVYECPGCKATIRDRSHPTNPPSILPRAGRIRFW
jgi:hypothetical protein